MVHVYNGAFTHDYLSYVQGRVSSDAHGRLFNAIIRRCVAKRLHPPRPSALSVPPRPLSFAIVSSRSYRFSSRTLVRSFGSIGRLFRSTSEKRNRERWRRAFHGWSFRRRWFSSQALFYLRDRRPRRPIEKLTFSLKVVLRENAAIRNNFDVDVTFVSSKIKRKCNILSSENRQ